MVGRPSAVPSSPEVSARMSRHPRRDSGPELGLRRVLHRAGLRYRVQLQVPGRPRRTIDIAFPRWKVAVFVNGCFWHGCPEHRSDPVSNAAFWREKIDGNIARDADTDRHLLLLGWRVLRVWEHEPAAEAAGRVVDLVARAKAEIGAVPPARRRRAVVPDF